MTTANLTGLVAGRYADDIQPVPLTNLSDRLDANVAGKWRLAEQVFGNENGPAAAAAASSGMQT